MDNRSDINDGAECPFCLEPMGLEQREQGSWLVCPNGCPTDTEVAPRKPPAAETPPARTRKAGSS